jgi:hypothetical protein
LIRYPFRIAKKHDFLREILRCLPFTAVLSMTGTAKTTGREQQEENDSQVMENKCQEVAM